MILSFTEWRITICFMICRQYGVTGTISQNVRTIFGNDNGFCFWIVRFTFPIRQQPIRKSLMTSLQQHSDGNTGLSIESSNTLATVS